MQNFLNVNQFKGFVVLGRQGESKSYEEFLDELGDPEAAKVATIKQLEGKTFPIYLANYEPLLTAVLEQADLTLDDVTTINFPDDEKAALAMIGGEGDFYMGGLPSEINLLMNHPDEFKLIGGAEILGPAGLWYSNIASTEEWLASNEEAAQKIAALSYRFNRFVQEYPDAVLPIVVESMNAHSGVATDPDELKFIFDTFLDFRTYQQDAETAFNPESPLYWEDSASYYVERSQELPEDADYLRQNPLNEWFEKFLQNEDLTAWVDAELGTIGTEPAPPPPPQVQIPSEPYVIRVGNTPFFDYQFWSVADEFGWDEEFRNSTCSSNGSPKAVLPSRPLLTAL